MGGLGAHATIDLDLRLQATAGDFVTQTTNLGHLVVKELLTAEARFDRHDKHHVEFVKDVEDRLDRFGRTDREASLAAHVAQLTRKTNRSMRRSHMEADGSRTKLGVFRSPTVRILDHQMHVDRKVSDLADASHNRLTQRQIRNEMMVHHVHVNEIGVGNGLKVTFQITEVSGQDARCDLNSHGSHSMEGNRLDVTCCRTGHRHMRRMSHRLP